MQVKTSLQGLRSNQLFLVAEMESRGIDVMALDQGYDLLLAVHQGKFELLLDIDSSAVPYPAARILENKYLTKLVLAKAQLSVPRGLEFGPDHIKEALVFAKQLGGPIVVKPSEGANGEEVHVHLETPQEVEQAIHSIQAHHPTKNYVVEELARGEEYRVFYTRRGNYAVLHRSPPTVKGDGKSTLEQLVTSENQRRNVPGVTTLAPILLDGVAEAFLRKRGLSKAQVLAAGQSVPVRPNTNIGSGGTSVDFTDRVHPSVLEIARCALRALPGMPYVGMDLMTIDASREQTAEDYRILEINPLPSLGIHMTPTQGIARNVASYVVDIIFPATCSNSLASIGNRYLPVDAD